MWNLSSGRRVQLDGINNNWVVEAKWTGRNSAAFATSPFNPNNTGVYNEARTLDQIDRQIRFAQEQGLKGVRWATSNQAARDHFESLFRTHFEE